MDSEKMETPNTEPIVIRDCIICTKPLNPLELRLERSYHYDCVVCEHCGGVITEEILVKFLKGNGPRAHSLCEEKYQSEVLDARPVTITQRELNYLNLCRTMIEPELSRTIEDNQNRAENAFAKWNHQKSIEETYVSLKKMQSIAAVCSIAVKNIKDQLDIKIRREEMDIARQKKLSEQVGEATEYRENQKITIEKKREKSSPLGKAIKALMAIPGMTESKARAKLDEMRLTNIVQEKLLSAQSIDSLNSIETETETEEGDKND